MTDELCNDNKPANTGRRKLLQGATCVGAASFAPSVFGNVLSTDSEPVLTGKLICSISNPIKTLVLHNHSDKTMVIKKLSRSAFMFDGNIIDCNTACLSSALTIPPNQEMQVQFDRRKQFVFTHRAEDYRRIQYRVARLNDGTRIIPFTAKLQGNIATVT